MKQEEQKVEQADPNKIYERVVHLGTKVTVNFGLADKNDDIIGLKPIEFVLQACNADTFAQGLQFINSEKEKAIAAYVKDAVNDVAVKATNA